MVASMGLPKRRATYEDLVTVPDHLVAEILDGELVTSPRPASPHAVASGALHGALYGAFHGDGNAPDSPGGWWVLIEPELHLGDDILVPDLAAWQRTRLPTIPNVAAFTLVPDWICETISPSTSRIDRVRKMPIYARAGVRQLWIVDPLLRTLEVFRCEGGRWVMVAAFGGDDVVRAEPFAAIALALARWWLQG